MKKSLLVLSITALLFSCKKETTPAEFTPTDNTGTAYIKGNLTKNVITPNGNGNWTSNTTVAASGVNVSVRVLKSDLYPNSNAQGADVYTGTTDVNGNYNIAIKANGWGVKAYIVIDGFSATLDTVINGVKKPGPYALYVGTSANLNAFSGQTTWLSYDFNASNLTSNPNNIVIGTAIVTGSVDMNIVKSVQTGTNTPVLSTTNIAVPAGTKIYLSLDMDPTTLAPKTYEATTDASGKYTFNLETVKNGTSGFNQNATIWINDFSTTRDTIKVINTTTTTVTGPAGVFNKSQTVQNGLFSNEIRNAVYVTYNSFTQN